MLGQSDARSPKFLWVSHMGGRNPGTWATSPCFSHEQGAGWKRSNRTRMGAHMGCQQYRQQLHRLCHSPGPGAPPPDQSHSLPTPAQCNTTAQDVNRAGPGQTHAVLAVPRTRGCVHTHRSAQKNRTTWPSNPNEQQKHPGEHGQRTRGAGGHPRVGQVAGMAEPSRPPGRNPRRATRETLAGREGLIPGHWDVWEVLCLLSSSRNKNK